MKAKANTPIYVVLSIILFCFSSINYARGERKNRVDWIPEIFPSINHCTPKNLYFDGENWSSNQGKVENFGYTNPTLRGQVADYKIDEDFFGYRADLFSIPSGTSSVYAVRVSARANELAEAIQKATGIKIQIINKGKPKSGVAYLTPLSNGKTNFVCFTYEY